MSDEKQFLIFARSNRGNTIPTAFPPTAAIFDLDQSTKPDKTVLVVGGSPTGRLMVDLLDAMSRAGKHDVVVLDSLSDRLSEAMNEISYAAIEAKLAMQNIGLNFERIRFDKPFWRPSKGWRKHVRRTKAAERRQR